MYYFLQYSGVPQVPGNLWDLSRSSLSFLRNRAIVDIHVNREKCREVQQNSDAHTTLYFLDPASINPTQQVSWWIAVVDAATALECMREECGPYREDIVWYLVVNGTPFLTLQWIPDPKPSDMVYPPCVGLRYHAPGYKPDLVDYISYTTAHNAFLREPRVHAALLRGGIVWRLAIDALGALAVLEGPSYDSVFRGRTWELSDGSFMCDNGLSVEETDLICGVYHVYTGMY
jgi:hypothetical protein